MLYSKQMCGRIDQNENPRLYLNSIGWTDAAIDSQATARSNVPPGTYVPVLHLQDGQQCVDDTFWSYRPAWATAATPAPGKKRIPIAINAKLEKLMGAYWKPLLRAGRGIVCASGWYEWTGEKGSKQPWHFHRKDGAPLFLLALAHFGPFKENRAGPGSGPPFVHDLSLGKSQSCKSWCLVTGTRIRAKTTAQSQCQCK